MPENRTTPAPPRHDPRRHAASRTDEYLYAQLIPYIGNKRKLLPLIWRAIDWTRAQPGVGRSPRRAKGGAGAFVDLFAGSTVVARLAKTLGYRTIANDWEPYAYQIARGTIALNAPPPFSALGGSAAVFDLLDRAEPVEGYVATHLCPADDQRPDPENERMFFTRANGRRIDAIRARLARWERDGLIGEAELAYVLSALIYAVSYVSNTSGVFKGFHRGWGGKTSTALYRILSRLTLRPPVLFDNGQENLALRHDAQAVAGDLRAIAGARPEIVYLDPPYNQHPYGSNYHVLNTVALGDAPPVHPRIKVNGRSVDKSAIRRDWRTERRSAFNSAAQAPAALRRLVESIEARWLMLSYSTDGNIPLADVLAPLSERGPLEVFTQKYKRYRVSTPRMSPRPHNVEFVAVVDLEGKGMRSAADAWEERIRAMGGGAS